MSLVTFLLVCKALVSVHVHTCREKAADDYHFLFFALGTSPSRLGGSLTSLGGLAGDCVWTVHSAGSFVEDHWLLVFTTDPSEDVLLLLLPSAA